MALKDAIIYARQNPDSEYAKELKARITSGRIPQNEVTVALSEADKVAPVKTPTKEVAQAQSIKPEKDTTLANLADGIAKGELSTLKGVGELGNKIYEQTAGRVVNAALGKGFTPDKVENIYSRETPSLQAENATEKAGKAIEQIAEFALPAGAVNRAQKSIGTLIKGTELLPTVGRIAGRAASEAFGTGLVGGVQSGGDVKDTLIAAGTGGLLKLGTGVVGESLKAFKIPQALYSKVFKTSFRDSLDELKSIGISNFKKESPAEYARLVEQGIIKNADSATPVIDETLAAQALDRGLKGSLKNMSSGVVKDTLLLEEQAQNLAKNYTKPIVLEPQYKNVLNKVAQEYEDVGFGELANKAKELANKITPAGELNAADSLSLRRLLDGLRRASSFNPSPSLSTSQMNFKTLSDALRKKLAAIPEFADTMKEYKFNIEALESLAKEAARRNNKEVLGLIDSILLGGGMGAGEPVTGGIMAGVRKALTTPRAVTNIGQKIQKSGSLTKKGAVLKGAAIKTGEEITR